MTAVLQSLSDAVQAIGTVLNALATDANFAFLRWAALLALGLGLFATLIGILRSGAG